MSMTFNGKPFNAKTFEQELKRAVYDQASDHIAKETSTTRLLCPVHNVRPTIPLNLSSNIGC